MGQLAKIVSDINEFLEQEANNKKIVAVITGDYTTGKTTIGLALEKFFRNIVFVIGDNFRKKIVFGKNKKENYKNFLSSYDVSLIKKIIESFLNDKDIPIWFKENHVIRKKIYHNHCKNILLLELQFVFDKHFSSLPIDCVVEVRSSKKDIEARRCVRIIKKLDKIRFDDILLIYKDLKVAAKNKFKLKVAKFNN